MKDKSTPRGTIHEISELRVQGVGYRLFNRPEGPYKITRFSKSSKIGTGGQKVGRSWQTWKKYETCNEVRDAWLSLYYKSEQNPNRRPLREVADKPVVLPAIVDQDEYAQRVVNFHVAAGQHASAAVYCAAAAGAVMLQRKKELGWGKGFTAWKESLELPDGRRLASTTADRYMALAKEIEARIKALPANSPLVGNLTEGQLSPLQLLAEFDPSKVNDLRRQAILEAVKQVTNQESLTQLYFDWGIMRQPKRLGGDHGGGAAMAAKAKNRNERQAQEACAEWLELLQKIRAFVLVRKKHIYLGDEGMHLGKQALKDVLKVLEVNQ